MGSRGDTLGPGLTVRASGLRPHGPGLDVVRGFAEETGDTLVLVLADHECSGFSLIGALAGTVDALCAAPSDAGLLDPLVQPDRQKRVGTYDAAAFPRYAILGDGSR